MFFGPVKKFCVFLLGTLLFASYAYAGTETVQTSALSLPFIKNVGQFSKGIKFQSQLMPGIFEVTRDTLVYRFPSSSGFSEVPVKGSLKPQGKKLSPAAVNYFVGDKKSWKSNVPSYDTISLGNVFKGVTLELQAKQNTVEKILYLKPRAKVESILFKVSSNVKLSIADSGELTVSPKDESEPAIFSYSKPVAYQMIDGKKVDVSVKYTLKDTQTYGFAVGEYDSSKVLVIDPELDTKVFSTYIGGTGTTDVGNDIKIDSNGNIFVFGSTNSANFPTTTGAFQTTTAAQAHPFVAKFNSSLSQLLAMTFVGGSGNFEPSSDMEIDASNNIFVFGYTNSTNFPTTTGAYQVALNGGASDFFITKLNNNLNTLLASTYLGGGSGDQGTSRMMIDSLGRPIVVGYTFSTNFPTTSLAYRTSYYGNANGDGVVSVLSSDLTTLVYSSYVGGAGLDVLTGICLDSSNNIIVSGFTSSTDIDVSATAYQKINKNSGGINNTYFLFKFDPTLSTRIAATYLGGSNNEGGANGLCEVDPDGNIYLAGTTKSTDFPTTTGAYDVTKIGGTTAFSGTLSKFSSDFSQLLASTYYQSPDGVGPVSARGFALDGFGDPVYFGRTTVTIPTTTGAFQGSNAGSNDFFVAKFNKSLTGLLGATYFGGSGAESANAVAVNLLTIEPHNNIYYFTGSTQSANYPVSNGAYSTSLVGTQNVAISSLISKPAIYSLSSVIAGQTSTLTIVGSGFAPSSSVYVNGVQISTASVVANSSTQITAVVDSSYIPTYGTGSVYISTAGIVSSTPSVLTINNPVPTVSDVSPSRVAQGSASTTFTITGSNFNTSTAVTFAGESVTLTLVNSTVLTVSLNSSKFASVGDYTFVVTNPAPGGGSANATMSVYSTNSSPGAVSSLLATPAPSVVNHVVPTKESVGTGQNLVTPVLPLSNSEIPITSNASSGSCSPSKPFTRTLSIGTKNSEVLMLQKTLNCLGFSVAQSGPGASGKETSLFGSRTFKALVQFQKKYLDKSLWGKLGVVGPNTRRVLNTLR